MITLTAFKVNAQSKGADPTQPPLAVNSFVAEEKNTSLPNLEAIFVTSSGNRAIINGRVYLEGQNENGLKVKSISADTVQIEVLKNDKNDKNDKNNKVQIVTFSLASVNVVSRPAVENK